MQSRGARRLRNSLAVAAAAVTVTTVASGAARPDPYGAPAPLPALSAPTIEARYSATRQAITQALGTARRVHDSGRTRTLSGFLTPGRRFLSFDARGTGRVVEVIGDLATARRVAIVVPGADNTLANYSAWKFVGGGARALYDEGRRLDPAARLAVVAWLGYKSPSTLSTDVLTAGRARGASRELREFVSGIRRVNGSAQVDLLCHSYGSVVCGEAAKGLPVQDIALYGSPGTTADRASELKSPARIWAGRATGDWMGSVPHVRLLGIGFGQDPVSPAFGARTFDAGAGEHSEYLKPGSPSLRNLTLIALGRDMEVPRA